MSTNCHRPIDFDREALVELPAVIPGVDLFLNKADAEEYNRDPDLYVAKHVGFDKVEEYHEFLMSGGQPMCGAHDQRDAMQIRGRRAGLGPGFLARTTPEGIMSHAYEEGDAA